MHGCGIRVLRCCFERLERTAVSPRRNIVIPSPCAAIPHEGSAARTPSKSQAPPRGVPGKAVTAVE